MSLQFYNEDPCTKSTLSLHEKVTESCEILGKVDSTPLLVGLSLSFRMRWRHGSADLHSNQSNMSADPVQPVFVHTYHRHRDILLTMP